MTGKLTALAVTRAKERGTYGDGGGLYLQVARGGTKSWILRYKRAGKTRHLGLGPLAVVSLREARERAVNARRFLLDGHDPIEKKAAARTADRLAAAGAMSFDACSAAYIAAHRAGWRSSKHASDWAFSLQAYAHPIIGALPVRAITTALVMRVIEPLWMTKSETGSRVRGRIEAILDWAKVRGYRDGDNPARLKGHLDHLLPDRKKVRKVEHYAALPYADLPAFMSELRQLETNSQESGDKFTTKDVAANQPNSGFATLIAAHALEFLILTAARSGELRKARWSEIDGATWIIPAAHTKLHKEHRVPLSQRALDILASLPRLNDYIFPGHHIGQGLGGDPMLEVLRGMSPQLGGDVTVHGFRSTFRDWAAECTAFPNEVWEAALAHAVKGKTEAAYRRGDLFEKRTRLMQAWAVYCSTESARAESVVPIRATP